MKQIIIRFLELNGFKKVEPNRYVLQGENVTLNGEIIVANPSGAQFIVGAISQIGLLTLIGYLTYTGIISKLYKS